MLGVSPLELAMIAVIGLIIFGPDRLPKYAAEAAKFVRDLRRMASSARQDLTQALGNELPDLDLGDLNPTTFLKGNVLDLLDDATAPASGNGAHGGRPRGPRGASGGPPDAVAAGSADAMGAGDGTAAGDGADGSNADEAASGRSRPRGDFDADTT
jgi:sec-independent protein translocase protein TatB